MAETNATKPTKKMVKIKLQKTRNEKDDVYVGVNGKTYLIKRGEEVEVPISVLEVLDNKEKMLSEAFEFEEAAKSASGQK